MSSLHAGLWGGGGNVPKPKPKIILRQTNFAGVSVYYQQALKLWVQASSLPDPSVPGSKKFKPKFPEIAKRDSLKGPKHEIFESRFFTEIRPVRIGDLGTGEKKMKFCKLESSF
jgi:hypothetical protein